MLGPILLFINDLKNIQYPLNLIFFADTTISFFNKTISDLEHIINETLLLSQNGYLITDYT